MLLSENKYKVPVPLYRSTVRYTTDTTENTVRNMDVLSIHESRNNASMLKQWQQQQQPQQQLVLYLETAKEKTPKNVETN